MARPDPVLRTRLPDERGQVLPLVVVAILLSAVALAGLVHLGAVAARRAAAQAAADATALAGAAEGRPAAEAVAQENGARLVVFRAVGDEVEVTVRRRGVAATARARWVPDVVSVGPPLDPAPG